MSTPSPPRRESRLGEGKASGLMFADDFVEISETPEGLLKEIEKALAYTRKWKATANVRHCEVVIGDEDNENPVTSNCKRGKYELPIVDRYACLGVDISKRLLLGWTHGKSSGKG